ncbi:replication protein A 70 kDa DNA-binding subunit D-like isoform X2 [Cannabis sativa]|nr:replication protein A 70 kDa DNA-binding subunit D-like isoform X2 [Cannabis sativa]
MIRVRVCRMWESLNTKKNGELIHLNLIFIDEQENLIHATITKTLVPRFKNLLSEGSLYSIKGFKVVKSTGEYRPLSNEYRIIFLVGTSLMKLEEETIQIPINGFQFITPNLIDLRVNNNEILSDVVGCLRGVGDYETVGGGWKKRDITILTNYSETSKITLWGDLGKMFEPKLYEKDNGPVIVIVTSTTIKNFRGEVSYSTTTASKIYINLKTDYVASLVEKFSTISNGVEVIERSNVNKISPEEEMFLNRMNIEELLKTDWSPQLKEYFLTVRGKITEIDNTFGWYYISCQKCFRKLELEDGVYKCSKCNNKCDYPLVKYKIHIKVEDKTAETTLVIFNDIAESLLDTAANKLFKQTTNDVPTEIQSLCGREFVYKLKLNTFNLKYGHENFTVSKVFNLNEKLEEQDELKKIKDHKEKNNNTNEENENKNRKELHFKDITAAKDLEDSDEDYHHSSSLTKKNRKNIIIEDDSDDENMNQKRLRK